MEDNKIERLNIRLRKSQKEYIRKRARQNGMTISEYMLWLVMKDIKEEEQKRCKVESNNVDMIVNELCKNIKELIKINSDLESNK